MLHTERSVSYTMIRADVPYARYCTVRTYTLYSTVLLLFVSTSQARTTTVSPPKFYTSIILIHYRLMIYCTYNSAVQFTRYTVS